MSMSTQNFITKQKQTDAVGDGSDATSTKGSTPVGGPKDLQGNKVAVPNADHLNTFGKGKGGPGSREYNDSNR